jgi:opacity protein-like surface antigen
MAEEFVKKYTIALAALCFCFAAVKSASAQIPTNGNIFVGYSYMSADLGSDRANLNGWNASVEGKVLPFLGIVGDVDGHYGSPGALTSGACPLLTGSCAFSASNSFNQHDYLFGPRATVTVGNVCPFANFLVGISHINESDDALKNSDTSFAYALGGGLDYHLVPLVSLRVAADMVQTRFFSNTQNNVRISTGIAFHF